MGVCWPKWLPTMPNRSGIRTRRTTSLGWQAARAVEEAAARVARLIGADPDEIFFTSGATESNNMALLGLGRRAAGGSRRRILVSAIEHKCVLASVRALEEQYAFTVEQIPVDRQGRINLAALEDMLGEDVLAVSVMAVNNEIGTIQDLVTLSGHVRRHGAVFHCDAAQAPMGMAMDGVATHTDLLSLSGHKMYGPKGVGIVFIARSLQDRIEPLIYGGGQQGGLRSGTVPVPLCVGMGAAAQLLNTEEAQRKRGELRRCRDVFVRGLTGLSWPIRSIGPQGEQGIPAMQAFVFMGLPRTRYWERFNPVLPLQPAPHAHRVSLSHRTSCGRSASMRTTQKQPYASAWASERLMKTLNKRWR